MYEGHKYVFPKGRGKGMISMCISIAIFSSQGILPALKSFDFFGRQYSLDPMAPKVKAMPTVPAKTGGVTAAGSSQSSGKASAQGGMIADNPEPKKELWTKET